MQTQKAPILDGVQIFLIGCIIAVFGFAFVCAASDNRLMKQCGDDQECRGHVYAWGTLPEGWSDKIASEGRE